MNDTDHDDDETRTPPESPMAIAQAFYARANVDIGVEHVDALAAAIHRYGDLRARESEVDTMNLAIAVRVEESLRRGEDTANVINLRPPTWPLFLPALLAIAGFVAGWVVWR